MVAIQPDNVRTAAAHLRDRATVAGELDTDVRQAATLSELDASSELAACAEIDEELDLLARILVLRAEEAEGFFLPGNNWRLTSVLLASLIDDRGAVAEMTAPLALHILNEQGMAAAVGGSNPASTDDPFDSLVFTVDSLRALAADPASPPELAAAATFLADNPLIVEVTGSWEATGASLPSHRVDEIPLRDIAAFLAQNELLRQIVGPGGVVTPGDIHAYLDDDALTAAGIDPQRFDELALPRSTEGLLIAAMNHDTFNHSPTLAREFLELFPIDYLDGQSIDIRATNSDAIERVYNAATSDLSDSQQDFIIRALLTASLPESTSGIRNELITSNYAEVAAWTNELLNGSTPVTDPNFRGINWFFLGTSASDSVSPVIEGELRVLTDVIWPGFGTPDAVGQDVADGNQAIYHHFITALGSYWETGSTGRPRLDEAFARLEEAAATDDIVEAQHLVAESTVLFSIEEQIIVDPYLQLDGLGVTDHMGAHTATLGDTAGSIFADVVTDPATLVTLPVAPVAGPLVAPLATLSFLTDSPSRLFGGSRSAAEVMTDEGVLSVQAQGEDLMPPIAIGEAVPQPTQDNNYIDPDVLGARLPSEFDWTQTQANDWTSLEERMPIIEDVTILTLTEPALPAMVEDQRRGNLGAPR